MTFSVRKHVNTHIHTCVHQNIFTITNEYSNENINIYYIPFRWNTVIVNHIIFEFFSNKFYIYKENCLSSQNIQTSLTLPLFIVVPGMWAVMYFVFGSRVSNFVSTIFLLKFLTVQQCGIFSFHFMIKHLCFAWNYITIWSVCHLNMYKSLQTCNHRKVVNYFRIICFIITTII